MTTGADGFLRPVPSDTDVNDGRLYPLSADAGGAASITGAGQIASAEAIGQPTVTPVSGAATIDGGSVASAEAFGAPSVALSVSAAGIASLNRSGRQALLPESQPHYRHHPAHQSYQN